MFAKAREWFPALMVVAVAAFVLFAPDTAWAADEQILSDAVEKIKAVWTNLRQVIYIIGGIGLVVMAIFAFFGRFKWGHFLALAGGLFLVASADALIRFLGGDNSNNADLPWSS